MSILRKELRDIAAYNFDVILLNTKNRLKVMDDSVLLGGNAEFLRNIRSLSILNHDKLLQLYQAGPSSFSENAAKEQKPQGIAISALKSKLKNLETILMLQNPMHYLPSLYESMINERALGRRDGLRSLLGNGQNSIKQLYQTPFMFLSLPA